MAKKHVLKTCILTVNSKCNGLKYFGQSCSRLRPEICEERAKLEEMLKSKADAIESERGDDEPLGVC